MTTKGKKAPEETKEKVYLTDEQSAELDFGKGDDEDEA